MTTPPKKSYRRYVGGSIRVNLRGVLDDFPQCNVPHPDEGYRVAGWKLPIMPLKGIAHATPRELGVPNHAAKKIQAYEALDRQAKALGFTDARQAMQVLSDALKEGRGK
jgi:hypothetical protein